MSQLKLSCLICALDIVYMCFAAGFPAWLCREQRVQARCRGDGAASGVSWGRFPPRDEEDMQSAGVLGFGADCSSFFGVMPLLSV